VLWFSVKLSIGAILRENWLRLKLKIFIPFAVAVHVRRKNVWQSKAWSTKRMVKSFQLRSGLSALLKVSARCRWRTRLNGRLVRHDRRLPDQNRITDDTTELICSQEGNTGSNRSRREMINLTAISLGSGCCEKLSWTQNTSSLMYCPTVSKCFWGASIIS